MKTSELPEGTILIEIREIYDGWSIAKLPDGTLINRWDPIDFPRRWAETQAYIKEQS